jgi:DNA (cytosine-5)-methyltransferase 1
MRQCSLLEIFKMEPHKQRAHRIEPMRVYDFFCGAGGFSEGARAAGCRVVFACDADAEALAVHAQNHPEPECVHLCATLPLCDDALPFPTDGARFHVHGSPPCWAFTGMSYWNASKNRDVEQTRSLDLVEWYIGMATSSSATSWSFEQVPAPPVIAALEAARRKTPSKIAYKIFDLSLLGVPQRRKRVIAGSPHLIARLQRLSCDARKRSVRQTLLVGGTHIRPKNTAWVRRLRGGSERGLTRARQTKYVYKLTGSGITWPVDGLSPTVTTRGADIWTKLIDGVMVPGPLLSTRESQLLQTFPEEYRFSPSRRSAMRQIGNAVPPLVAKLMLSADSSSLTTH